MTMRKTTVGILALVFCMLTLLWGGALRADPVTLSGVRIQDNSLPWSRISGTDNARITGGNISGVVTDNLYQPSGVSGGILIKKSYATGSSGGNIRFGTNNNGTNYRAWGGPGASLPDNTTYILPIVNPPAGSSFGTFIVGPRAGQSSGVTQTYYGAFDSTYFAVDNDSISLPPGGNDTNVLYGNGAWVVPTASAIGIYDTVLMHDFDSTAQAPAEIQVWDNVVGYTGLYVSVTPGWYTFHAKLFVDAHSTGGHQYSVGFASGTADYIIYQIRSYVVGGDNLIINSRHTATNSNAGSSGDNTVFTEIDGSFNFSSGSGDIGIWFSQLNAAGVSIVRRGSTLSVRKYR